MDILKQLEEGKPFSGRNGAFIGRVEPQSIEGDTLKVICDKSGTRWHENYSMLFGRLNVEITTSYDKV